MSLPVGAARGCRRLGPLLGSQHADSGRAGVDPGVDPSPTLATVPSRCPGLPSFPYVIVGGSVLGDWWRGGTGSTMINSSGPTDALVSTWSRAVARVGTVADVERSANNAPSMFSTMKLRPVRRNGR